MQKFVQGLLVALAVLLGGFHAEAGSVAMTSDGFVDLSKFDELEKVYIFKTAENVMISVTDEHREEILSRKNGSIRFRKIVILTYDMLSTEAKRADLADLSEIYGLKAKNFTFGLEGISDLKELEEFDARVEAAKQKYINSVLQRHADKKGTNVPPAEMKDIAKRMGTNIFDAAMEKVVDAE